MSLDNLEAISKKYKVAKNRFFERNSRFNHFKDIDDTRKDEIRNNANIWLEKCSKKETIRKGLSLFYNLNNSNFNPNISSKYDGQKTYELFDFVNNDEELLFYMFIMDPELKLLTIYYEEVRMDNIKKRYYEEFNIALDTRLLKIELAYNNKFRAIIDNFDYKKTLNK